MKKILSLSLAVLLALSMLGCTGQKSADGMSSATAKSQKAASPAGFVQLKV